MAVLVGFWMIAIVGMPAAFGNATASPWIRYRPAAALPTSPYQKIQHFKQILIKP
jgi:hypothetical protein